MIVSQLTSNESSHRRVASETKKPPNLFKNQAGKMSFSKPDAFLERREAYFRKQVV